MEALQQKHVLGSFEPKLIYLGSTWGRYLQIPREERRRGTCPETADSVHGGMEQDCPNNISTSVWSGKVGDLRDLKTSYRGSTEVT